MDVKTLATPLALACVVLAAASCGGGSASPTTSAGGIPATTVATTAPPPPPTTAVPPPATTAPPAPTTTAPPPTTAAPPPPPTTMPPGAVLSLPVGPDGIEYRGGGGEIETTGPSLFAVDPSGGIHIADPVGQRIVSFAGGTLTSLSLPPLDILGVTAIAAADDHLVLVEVFFAPLRQRVHRVGFDGAVRQTVDLPEGFRLEDGLSGVLVGPSGEIIVEYAGGAHYGVLDPVTATFTSTTELTLGDTTVIPHSPDLEIDGVLITADLTGDFGGLRYLGTASDGTHVVSRDDVVATAPAFEVLTTVEWYAPDGTFLGSARVPALDEQFISTPPGVAVGGDGSVYVLVAGERTVEVVVLAREPRRITEYTPPV